MKSDILNLSARPGARDSLNRAIRACRVELYAIGTDRALARRFPFSVFEIMETRLRYRLTGEQLAAVCRYAVAVNGSPEGVAFDLFGDGNLERMRDAADAVRYACEEVER